MLTEFVRDHAFTIAWFGVMAFVWFGWGQEDPAPGWPARLGIGSGVGLVFAGIFGAIVALRWDEGTALDGRYQWFGVLVGAEVVLAGLGCLVLFRRGASRWMAWWVAVVVALHFLPLAWLLRDPSLVVLSLIQVGILGAAVPRLRSSGHPTSRVVGPVMGLTLLSFAAVSAAVFAARV